MSKLYKHILASCLLLVLFLPLVTVAAADSYNDGLNSVKIADSLIEEVGSTQKGFGTDSGLRPDNYQTNQLPVVIGRILNAFLGLLGVILVLLVVYSGYLWMTAAGNSEQVNKAKQIITRAIIGMVIVMASYFISGFVVEAIMKSTVGGGT